MKMNASFVRWFLITTLISFHLQDSLAIQSISKSPTPVPSQAQTPSPTHLPTQKPTIAAVSPTPMPSQTQSPLFTRRPTQQPTATAVSPTPMPSPAQAPLFTRRPTTDPTPLPSASPSRLPSQVPTTTLSSSPNPTAAGKTTAAPTLAPSKVGSGAGGGDDDDDEVSLPWGEHLTWASASAYALYAIGGVLVLGLLAWALVRRNRELKRLEMDDDAAFFGGNYNADPEAFLAPSNPLRMSDITRDLDEPSSGGAGAATSPFRGPERPRGGYAELADL